MSAERFAYFFPPNPVKHGILQRLSKDTQGNLQKKVVTQEGEAVTLELIQKHLSGPAHGKEQFRALGYLPGNYKGITVGVIDQDLKDYPEPGSIDDARLRLRDIAEGLGLTLFFEQSVRGGWHTFLWSDAVLSYLEMQHALKALVSLAGLPHRTEVFPKGEDCSSNWFILPYAGAGSDQRRLGLTYLATADGQAIPFDELDEWLSPSPAMVLRRLAATFSPVFRELPTSEPVDLAPDTLELLQEVAVQPPDQFERHRSIKAFLNIAKRAGNEAAMQHFLKSEMVQKVWVKDNSRDSRAWADEVDRWAAAKPSSRELGIAFLLQQGFSVPSLPKLETAQGNGNETSERRTQAQILLEIAEAEISELFHDEDNTGYATVTVNGHQESHKLRTKGFKTWLEHRYFLREKGAPNSEAMTGALNILEAKARFEGATCPVNVRIAGHNDKIYLDLVNNAWQVVEIDETGWRVLEQSPVKFRRNKGMAPLPVPVTGIDLATLQTFLNIHQEDWPLIAGWLVAAARPTGPYPLLVLHGEQGSAKSTTAKILRAMIDPSSAALRSEPKESRDLMIGAVNSWLLAFDNMSSVSSWLSDALCRLSTGGGFATRTLFENDEETILDATRPVILTGIEELATRGDLLSRCLVVYLPRIAKEQRKTERQFWQAFESQHAGLLGALLTVVSKGLKELPNVTLETLPRMADFAEWAVACEAGIGLEPGAFLQAYTRNRESANELALEVSPVPAEIRAMLESQQQSVGQVRILNCLTNSIRA